jgi:hypothetical protein
MLRNSEGKVIKEVAEHYRLYFESLLNRGFIQNDVTNSTRETGCEENNGATRSSTRADIYKVAGESGIVV